MGPRRRDQRPTLTHAELADATDLRSVIASALAVRPVLDDALQLAVWTYVCAEHAVRRPPADVIVTLTEMVVTATVADPTLRQPLLRRVVTWCVEAYFGHLPATLPKGDATPSPRRGVMELTR